MHGSFKTFAVFRMQSVFFWEFPRRLKLKSLCGKVYVGQSGRTIQHRIKEHGRHIRLMHPEKSALAEHSISYDHQINLQNAKLLSSKTGYMDRLSGKQLKSNCIPITSTERMP